MRIEVKGRNLQVTDELRELRRAANGEDRQAGLRACCARGGAGRCTHADGPGDGGGGAAAEGNARCAPRAPPWTPSTRSTSSPRTSRARSSAIATSAAGVASRAPRPTSRAPRRRPSKSCSRSPPTACDRRPEPGRSPARLKGYVHPRPRPSNGRSEAVQELRQARRANRRLGAGARAARGRRDQASSSPSCASARATARTLDDLLPESFALTREMGRRKMGMRHFDVQLIGGMVLHDGQIAEMRTGEGKTLTGDARRRAQRARRQGRPRRHRQRLPRPPRRGLDAPDLRGPRPDRRRAAEHAALRGEARGLRGRHHVRHELRVRLRLPARQHGHVAGGEGPARRPHRRGRQADRDAQLRDRRRGRQHPHRRGAHAADHLRRARAGGRPLRALRQARPGDDRRREARGDGPAHEEGVRRRLRLRVRREAQDGLDHRAGRRQGRALPRHRPPLPRRERRPGQPPDPVAEGRVAVQEGRRLRRHRRRGQDHRRVHRPDPGRPALVGGPAPGRRGQGGRARPRGEPDARDDHAAELLPHVRQARRHVGHGPDRGHRVHEDLQGRRGGDPHQPADGPHGQERPDLQDPGRQVARGRARDPGAPRQGPAGPRRHDLGRGLRAAVRAPAQGRRPAHRCSTPSPSTPSARARSSPRRAAPARSRSPPTWPAAASTSSSAATRST